MRNREGDRKKGGWKKTDWTLWESYVGNRWRTLISNEYFYLLPFSTRFPLSCLLFRFQRKDPTQWSFWPSGSGPSRAPTSGRTRELLAIARLWLSWGRRRTIHSYWTMEAETRTCSREDLESTITSPATARTLNVPFPCTDINFRQQKHLIRHVFNCTRLCKCIASYWKYSLWYGIEASMFRVWRSISPLGILSNDWPPAGNEVCLYPVRT